MTECNFYSPEEVKPLYDEIVPAYQNAFAGEPWYEVTKCEDKQQRCVGGLSLLAIGQKCETCNSCPSRPAYERVELVTRFENVAASRPTLWYVERYAGRVSMAALAWVASCETIEQEKYADNPDMQSWIEKKVTFVGDRLVAKLLRKDSESKKIIWLDEVFANKQVKTNGNLSNFAKMLRGFSDRLDQPIVAYRTIEPRMVSAAKNNFLYPDARIYEREIEVPDRRDFVTVAPNNNIGNYWSITAMGA